MTSMPMKDLIERLEKALTEAPCSIVANGQQWLGVDPSFVREIIAALTSVHAAKPQSIGDHEKLIAALREAAADGSFTEHKLMRQAADALESVPTERALADWVDSFVEHEAEKCNGFQSAVRFRDAIREAFNQEDSHE